MSPARLAASIPLTVALGTLVSAASCEAWHLSINSDGLLFVTVITDNDPSNRFRLRVREADGRIREGDVPPSGKVTINALTDGPMEITLLPPAGCEVKSANPRQVEVAAGDPVSVQFAVHCE